MTPIEKYFNGEIIQCSIGIIIGLISATLSLYGWFWLKSDLYKGMALPSFIIAFFLLIICIGVVIRSPKDIQRVSEFRLTHTEKIITQELPRMQKVMNNFRIIKIAEGIVVLIGLILFFTFANNPFVKGIAIGLMIQGSIMFIFDYFASLRGEPYLEYLKGIV